MPQERKDGVWVVGSRSSSWVEMSYNNECVPLLPYKHRFSQLYAAFIHNIAHLGVGATIAKIRSKYWIVNLHRLVRAITVKCVPCLIKKRETAMQIMGELPIHR